MATLSRKWLVLSQNGCGCSGCEFTACGSSQQWLRNSGIHVPASVSGTRSWSILLENGCCSLREHASLFSWTCFLRVHPALTESNSCGRHGFGRQHVTPRQSTSDHHCWLCEHFPSEPLYKCCHSSTGHASKSMCASTDLPIHTFQSQLAHIAPTRP